MVAFFLSHGSHLQIQDLQSWYHFKCNPNATKHKKCSWQILRNQVACTVKPWFVCLYVFVDASTSLHYFSDLWCKNNDGKQCTTSGTNQMLCGLRLHRLAFDCCSNDHFFTHIWSQTWRIHQNIWMFIVH